MHSSTVSLIILAVLAATVLMAEEKGCQLPNDSCGCIKRGVFNTDWLKANYPAVYEANKNNFEYPTVTYPNCSQIVVSCPNASSIISMSIEGVYKKLKANPFVTTSLECRDGFWYQEGIAYTIDSNLNSSRVSCATPLNP